VDQAGGAPVNYFEIGSPDPSRSRTFYGELFGWPFEEPTGPAPYWMVDEARGGLWDTSTMSGQSWAIFYVQVDDIAATLERAEELGATVAVPLTDNGSIEFAHVLDPHGNRLGIWQPKS
jgi:predicted enzyme related to lactoylglutathione lyase